MMFSFITFMHTFRHLICLVFFITFLACNPPITNKIDIKATIRQVDSLTFTNDTAAYKDNLLKASSLLKGAISQEPNNNLVRQLQITTYTLMRTPDSVLLVYQDWVKREPNSLQANLRRGLLYHVCKDEQKAKLDFKKVKLMLIGNMKLVNKETNDRDLNLLLNMSYDFFLIGEKEIAHKIISDIYKAHPSNARAKNAFLKFNNFDREIEISRQVGF